MEEKRISVSISLTAETYKKISADMEKEDASVSDRWNLWSFRRHEGCIK